jgi:nucleoside-diphosphate-sugar epimerase
MSSERWLITGALGCVGAWCCRQLVREGHTVVGLDLGSDRARAEMVLSAGELAAVEFVQGDITDLASLEQLMAARQASHVVHLAAMLWPLAAADPPRGALVNVVGTINVFEASRRCGVAGVSYASSAAVYDRSDGVHVAEDADGHPVSHYGVHKQANEGAARVYWRDHGLASVGLRPHVVYGPGRDHGLTAGPTLAMLAAARGEAYEIPFGGRAQFQYAADVAERFIDAARMASTESVVRNVGGPSEHVSDVVAAIEEVLPEAAGQITFKQDVLLPLPDEMESSQSPTTPLRQGVSETIELFRRAVGSAP